METPTETACKRHARGGYGCGPSTSRVVRRYADSLGRWVQEVLSKLAGKNTCVMLLLLLWHAMLRPPRPHTAVGGVTDLNDFLLITCVCVCCTTQEQRFALPACINRHTHFSGFTVREEYVRTIHYMRASCRGCAACTTPV